MRKKLYTILGAALSMGMVLSACSGGNQATPEQKPAEPSGTAEIPAAQKDSVLRVNIHMEPPTLHPAQATDTTSLMILKSIMEGLTRVGQDGKPQLAAAEDIKISEDLKTYTFKLRDLKWTNGDPVTAYDYEYAWKWALDPHNESEYAYQMYPILNAEKVKNKELPLDQLGVKAEDEKTLVVHLENPTPYFLELTAFATFFPVNQKATEGNKNWHAQAATYVGNGPFKLTKWEHGSQVIIEKNESYWDADTVKLTRVEMAIIEDQNTELSMFQNGELDWAGSPFSSLPTVAMPQLKQEGKMTTVPIAGTYMYKFNTKKPPFDNAKIRKAFSYAVDRQAIVENVTQGGQLPAMAYVPPTMFPENEKGVFQHHNVEEAKKLLAEGMKEAGYDKLPPITLSYNTGEAHAKIAQAIQDMWKQNLGVEVSLTNSEWKVHLEAVQEQDFQVARMAWLGDFNDAINFLELYTVPEGNNSTLWTSEPFNKLIKDSYTETDSAKRQQLMKDAEKILMDEMPIIPIYYYTYSYLKADNVKDVYMDGLGNVDLKWAYVE
ncbi:peptide ABC transporter substrate-binding protein [Ammoniphilus sp. CFH 90114]|uniref:peptide ABC transporter substrate-binding protein n=1 Tax=Ammoniphilus sp. CFH 90114 TaxID=2493665 RepID=UPI00100FCFB4|nr:peptide ABC transporter substrate-binding protein [Ammoniphilus sp. CFH 90114]RXT07820.1 peptide ABC transporter substrate-binding protein [Ammoniphilus sp. CFH 90114]